MTSSTSLFHYHSRSVVPSPSSFNRIAARADPSPLCPFPSQTDTSTAFGILGKVYLDGVIMVHGDHVKPGEDATEAKEAAFELIESTFVGVKNPKAEVERGFRFWDAVRPLPFSTSSFCGILRAAY